MYYELTPTPSKKAMLMRYEAEKKMMDEENERFISRLKKRKELDRKQMKKILEEDRRKRAARNKREKEISSQMAYYRHRLSINGNDKMSEAMLRTLIAKLNRAFQA